VLLVASCAFDSGLTKAEALWAAEGASDYSIDVTLLCACPVGTYRVTVREGQQTIVQAVKSGELRPAGGLALTVDDLFDRVQEGQGAHRLEVEYDPRHGFPTLIDIDPDPEVVDDEVRYTTVRYTPQPGE